MNTDLSQYEMMPTSALAKVAEKAMQEKDWGLSSLLMSLLANKALRLSNHCLRQQFEKTQLEAQAIILGINKNEIRKTNS